MSNLWKRVDAQREKKREAKNEKWEAAWLLFKQGADTAVEPSARHTEPNSAPCNVE